MFDHYIAVDWAQSNMAIARMTAIVDPYRMHLLSDWAKSEGLFFIAETSLYT